MTAKDWTNRLFGHGGVPLAPPLRAHRYVLRERLVTFRDDFPVEDEDGELAFSVDGRALQLRDTLILRDRHDTPLYLIPQHALHMKDVMEINRGDGRRAATVRREKVGTMRDRWTVIVPGGEPLRLRGAIKDHEYLVEARDRQLAEVSKRWFPHQHTYGVAITPGEDEALLVLIAAAVDQMTR